MCSLVETRLDDSLHKVCQNYSKIDKIGAGTYGTVYKAKKLDTGEIKALKKVVWNELDGITYYILREVAILKKLRHPNIIPLEEVIMVGSKLFMVFEFMDYDLSDYMAELNYLFPQDKIKSFMNQIISALYFCHGRKIVHRDLKPQNILVDKTGDIVKLGDFGLARIYPIPTKEMTEKITTVWYRPLSVILGRYQYGCSVDMWAAGCVFGELALGRPLFNGDSEIDVLFKIFQTLGTPFNDPFFSELCKWQDCFPRWTECKLDSLLASLLDEDAIDLIKNLLEYHDHSRISAKAALQHRYFDTLSKE